MNQYQSWGNFWRTFRSIGPYRLSWETSHQGIGPHGFSLKLIWTNGSQISLYVAEGVWPPGEVQRFWSLQSQPPFSLRPSLRPFRSLGCEDESHVAWISVRSSVFFQIWNWHRACHDILILSKTSCSDPAAAGPQCECSIQSAVTFGSTWGVARLPKFLSLFAEAWFLAEVFRGGL